MNLMQTETMSSREIAALVESRHDSVKRTIERIAEKGVITFTPMVEKPTGGRPSTAYLVDEESSYIVVAQLCPEFTARIVRRWRELERQISTPAIVAPDAGKLREALQTIREAEAAVAYLRTEADRLEAVLSGTPPALPTVDPVRMWRETFTQGTVSTAQAYEEYCQLCETVGQDPLSRQTFVSEVRSRFDLSKKAVRFGEQTLQAFTVH